MKKVLIISPRPTHPVIGGNRTAIYSCCQLLEKIGCEVHFLWYTEYCPKEEYKQMSIIWGERLFIYKKNLYHKIKRYAYRNLRFNLTGYYKCDDLYPSGIGYFTKKIDKKQDYDILIVNYFYLSRLFNLFNHKKKILYTHDVFTNKYQLTNLKFISLRPNDEMRAINRADSILSLQEEESTFLKFLTSKTVNTIYSYTQQKETLFVGNKNILYLSGDNNYNIDAITHFIINIFPAIIKQDSEIKLLIGGNICNSIKQFEEKSNIELLGFVENIETFYQLGDVVINPTFSGTGIKIKSFEAMAHGKIVVSHPHGIIGIYKKDIAPILVANNNNEYVEHIVKLFKEPLLLKDIKNKTINYISDLNSLIIKTFYNVIE